MQVVLSPGGHSPGGKSGQHRAIRHLKGWVQKSKCFCNRKCHRKQGSLTAQVVW